MPGNFGGVGQRFGLNSVPLQDEAVRLMGSRVRPGLVPSVAVHGL